MVAQLAAGDRSSRVLPHSCLSFTLYAWRLCLTRCPLVPSGLRKTIHAALAEGDGAEGGHAEGAADAERRCRGNLFGGELGLRRQVVDLRFVDQKEERVQPADDGIVRAVEVGILRLSRVSRLRVEL